MNSLKPALLDGKRKKPAGWRFLDDRYWQRSDETMCQSCGKRSPFDAADAARHDRGCEHYPRESVVRGPDLLPRVGVVDSPVSDGEAGGSGPENGGVVDRLVSNLRAVEKPGKAERSEVFKDWCRRGVCCNCGAPAPSDPHHEDTTIALLRRGVGTKCRDTLCVSLCRRCHDALDLPGGGYRLPAPDGGEHTREESLAILHDAQEERLTRAVALLPQEWRIEALSKALAAVPEAVLRVALLGEGSDAGR